ncbi:MAG: hypothetical protein ABUT20_03895 [Bacteroidota bacterium]
MKKVIFCATLCTIAISTFSQQATPSQALTKQDYLQKSKHQKTAAWILLGGGILIGSIRVEPNPDVVNSTNAVLLTTGLAAIGSSIILFVASSKNKKKAMSLSFKNQTAPFLQNKNFVYHSIPSLSLKFHL